MSYSKDLATAAREILADSDTIARLPDSLQLDGDNHNSFVAAERFNGSSLKITFQSQSETGKDAEVFFNVLKPRIDRLFRMFPDLQEVVLKLQSPTEIEVAKEFFTREDVSASKSVKTDTRRVAASYVSKRIVSATLTGFHPPNVNDFEEYGDGITMIAKVGDNHVVYGPDGIYVTFWNEDEDLFQGWKTDIKNAGNALQSVYNLFKLHQEGERSDREVLDTLEKSLGFEIEEG